MSRRRSHPLRWGLIGLTLIASACYFAFAREVPFRSHYEIDAVFRTANNLREGQPVRIAGVDVGKVVAIRHPESGEARVIVTLRIDDEGRPVHRNATVKIRPRLFLEGNWFIDLEPGTSREPELADGGVLPIQQTATPVQLGQVLTALQADTRRSLQMLFDEYSRAVEPDGADGFRRSIPRWEGAYRDSALVQQATLGERPHDLSDYIDSAGRVARGIDRDPERLKGLITDFATAASAFAREADSLERAIGELPRTLAAGEPALAALAENLPSLGRLARDLRPAVRETGKTIDVAFPFLRQARRLVSTAELRGLSHDLRPTVPPLARLTERTPDLFEQLRLASSCEREVLEPWSNDRVPDPNFPASGRVFQEAPKALPGLAGESRNGDANGQWVHVLTSAGDGTVWLGDGRFAQALFPILGTNPPLPRGRPPFEPGVACETQEPPDLRTRAGPGEPEVARGLPDTAAARRRYARAKAVALRWVEERLEVEGLDEAFRLVEEEVGR